jgi:hypothetical protein
MFDDERGYVEDYAFAGRDLGGGSGTLSMGVSGWVSSDTGTEPMTERASVGQLGAGHALTVQAA